jgi:hypothetical protein
MGASMKLCIADPPYLGRAARWYGKEGCGEGYGAGKADEHPEAYLWDLPETHVDLVKNLEKNYDGYAIALTVHSLSTYLSVIDTDSRNGIRVLSWVKPIAVPSGSRIATTWEPVIVKIPKERRGHGKGKSTKDHLVVNPPQNGFIGAKPAAWTEWVLDVMGYQAGDEVTDLFNGSGAVADAIADLPYKLDLGI